MQNAPSEASISDTIVNSIQTGQYPASDHVAATQLTRPILDQVKSRLKDAKTEIIGDISAYSRDIGPSVDGWIKQAKKLQEDIENSRKVAREIVQGANEAAELHEKQEDASKTADLLRGEVTFHQSLGEVLQRVQYITGALKDGQDHVERSDLGQSLQKLQLARERFEQLRSYRSTNAVQLLTQRAGRLRNLIADETKRQWDSCLFLNSSEDSITIRSSGEAKQNLDTVVHAAQELDIFEVSMVKTKNNLDTLIFEPILNPQPGSKPVKVEVSGTTLSLDSRTTNPTPFDVIDDMSISLTFLTTKLPPSMSSSLADALVPSIIDRLLDHWLNPFVPVDLTAIPEHDRLLKAVLDFATYLSSHEWPSHDKLRAWVEDAPPVWLARRREESLGAVRLLLSKNIRNTKTVERVETQELDGNEGLEVTNGDTDDWGAAWGDEDETLPTDTNTATLSSQKIPSSAEEQDDDDGAAWDLDAGDEVNEEENINRHQEANGEEDDAGDAWGWDEPVSTSQPVSPTKVQKQAEFGVPPKGSQNTERKELTLRENYTITGIPEGLNSLIVQVAEDAETLRKPEYAGCSIAPATLGLYSLPTLILAGYRALSPPFYQELPGGNMFIYNDTTRLVESLQEYASRQVTIDEASSLPRSSWPSSRMKLDADISALQSFGRRAYGREMESQRTILRDLLDGAQGFASCTESPFAAECESAVSMTVDRIRAVSKEWSDVLSRSALLQSLGSLLSTILNKIIVDIEDMSDISAEESTKLREFCNRMMGLSDLFAQQGPDGKVADTAHVYTPEWFKFAYLSEILDSSLRDITALWEDGVLKADFEASEVCDLVEALFADSPHRKDALRKIRAG